jgi:hypothetical protein
MLTFLDETRDTDLAAFHAPRPYSLLRLGLAVGAFAVLMMAPLMLMGLYAPVVALMGAPIGWLLANGVLALTPAGRGAMWTFGKGRSPSQTLRNGCIFFGLVGVLNLVLWLRPDVLRSLLVHR